MTEPCGKTLDALDPSHEVEALGPYTLDGDVDHSLTDALPEYTLHPLEIC